MSRTINMLSAKKVKLHGMTHPKWTTRDKITQYKGLINLYKRDREIIKVDSMVSKKKLHRELKNLHKQVEIDRNYLDNAVRGDKQQLRNTLADHRELQLAYQNSQPKKVVESVEQINFGKRKVLDRLRYEMDQKSQQLVDLKMEKSILEDRLRFPNLGKIKFEGVAQIITGKVQDAMLRQEAAVAIKHTYLQMISIMRKDALYFDAILNTIQNDGLAQSTCILNGTKLGQLATEYLDDRRQEYTTLEKIIIKDMTSRKNDLGIVQEQADNATMHIKSLIRRDSDVNTCEINIEVTRSETQLQSDMTIIERTLDFLKTATLVPTFDCIYPCLQQQAQQRGRLKTMARKCDRNRDVILNKLNHAQVLNDMLNNSMVETTTEYKLKKKELLEWMQFTKERIDNVNDDIKFWLDLKAKVRLGIRQLHQLCKLVRVPAGKDAPSILRNEWDPEENNGYKMIPPLITKLTYIVSYAQEAFNDSQMVEAFKVFENMMKERRIPEKEERSLQESSLLEGLYQEVSQQLTNEDIKKQSAEIVAANTKNDDLIPVFQAPPKKRWKK